MSGINDYCQTADANWDQPAGSGCPSDPGQRPVDAGASLLYEFGHRKRTAKTRAMTAIATLSATPTWVQYPGGTTTGSRFLTTWWNCRAEIRATAAPSSNSRTPRPSDT